MKKVFFITIFVIAGTIGADHSIASFSTEQTVKADIIHHGGGCRKSSPPGQCCHMDNSTGTVHCH